MWKKQVLFGFMVFIISGVGHADVGLTEYGLDHRYKFVENVETEDPRFYRKKYETNDLYIEVEFSKSRVQAIDYTPKDVRTGISDDLRRTLFEYNQRGGPFFSTHQEDNYENFINASKTVVSHVDFDGGATSKKVRFQTLWYHKNVYLAVQENIDTELIPWDQSQ